MSLAATYLTAGKMFNISSSLNKSAKPHCAVTPCFKGGADQFISSAAQHAARSPLQRLCTIDRADRRAVKLPPVLFNFATLQSIPTVRSQTCRPAPLDLTLQALPSALQNARGDAQDSCQLKPQNPSDVDEGDGQELPWAAWRRPCL